LTSGCLSPTLGYGIGLGYIPAAEAEPGREIMIEVRGSKISAVVAKKPFYKKPN
jgi:aminomethyltransferase